MLSRRMGPMLKKEMEKKGDLECVIILQICIFAIAI